VGYGFADHVVLTSDSGEYSALAQT
jgi:hypothetical protein